MHCFMVLSAVWVSLIKMDINNLTVLLYIYFTLCLSFTAAPQWKSAGKCIDWILYLRLYILCNLKSWCLILTRLKRACKLRTKFSTIRYTATWEFFMTMWCRERITINRNYRYSFFTSACECCIKMRTISVLYSISCWQILLLCFVLQSHTYCFSEGLSQRIKMRTISKCLLSSLLICIVFEPYIFYKHIYICSNVLCRNP